MQTQQRDQLALELFQAGVDAVGGFQATVRALASVDFDSPVHVVAIGKASDAMARGAKKILGDKLVSALVISKHGHISDELKGDTRFECLESGHPVPDQQSLEAGARLFDVVRALAPTERLLFLVSGGTSALVEYLNDGLTLESLQSLNDELLASGAAIGEMNRQRRQLSKIKGGQLALCVRCPVVQLLISDVPGDTLSDIGSGLLVPDDSTGMHKDLPVWQLINSKIIASSAIAQAAVAVAATNQSLVVNQYSGSLHGDVEAVVKNISQALVHAEKGVYIWGGEPTVVLPSLAGRGGRNQHLALSLARVAAQHPSMSILVCGTDGSDGPTVDAGGLINECSLSVAADKSIDIDDYLRRFDAGSALLKMEALVTTGPTGTNVMDLCVVIVE